MIVFDRMFTLVLRYLYSFLLLSVAQAGYVPLTEQDWLTIKTFVMDQHGGSDSSGTSAFKNNIAELRDIEKQLQDNSGSLARKEAQCFKNEVVTPFVNFSVGLSIVCAKAQVCYESLLRKRGKVFKSPNPRCVQCAQTFQPIVNKLFSIFKERGLINSDVQIGELDKYHGGGSCWFLKDVEDNYELFWKPDQADFLLEPSQDLLTLPLYTPFSDKALHKYKKQIFVDRAGHLIKDAFMVIHVTPREGVFVFQQNFFSGACGDSRRGVPPFCEEVVTGEDVMFQSLVKALKEDWERDGKKDEEATHAILIQSHETNEESACLLVCLEWLEESCQSTDKEFSDAALMMLEWIQDEAGRDIATLKEVLEEDLKEHAKAAYAERVRAEQKERQKVIASGGDLNTRPNKAHKNRKHMQKTRRTQASKSQVEKGTHEQPQEALQTLCEEMKTVGRAKFRDVKRVLNRVFKKLPKAMTESQRGAHHNIHIKGAGGVTVVRPHGRKDRSIPLKGLYAKVIQACLNGKGTDVEQPVREHKAP